MRERPFEDNSNLHLLLPSLAAFLTPILSCPFPHTGRYRAVASWSRIQGIGIPMWKAVEVLLIWAVAIVLAVPEAIAFDMVELSYWEQHLWVCMLASEQKSRFMRVRVHPNPNPNPAS